MWAMLAVLFTAQAAEEGELRWQWQDGEARRYELDTRIQLHQAMFLYGLDHPEVAVDELALGLVVGCTNVWSNKKLVDLECVVERANVQAGLMPGAFQGNDQLAQAALEHHSELLVGKTIDVTLSRDGMLRQVNVDGLPHSNRREGAIRETLQQLVTRCFSAFEVMLPDDGAASWTWDRKGSWAMGFPTSTGMQGGAKIEGSLENGDTEVKRLAFTGNGTRGASSDATDFYTWELVALADFDVQTGALVEQQVWTGADPNASTTDIGPRMVANGRRSSAGGSSVTKASMGGAGSASLGRVGFSDVGGTDSLLFSSADMLPAAYQQLSRARLLRDGERGQVSETRILR